MSFTLLKQVKKKFPTADNKTLLLAAFKRWIETVPGDRLLDFLIDAQWKGSLKKTELHRCFHIEVMYGTKMVPRDEKTWRVKRCVADGCDWFGLSRVRMKKCPECQGPTVEALGGAMTYPSKKRKAPGKKK